MTGVRSDLFNAYRKAYWFQPPPSLYLEILGIIESLHRDGLKMGIVTQKEREFEIDGLLAGAGRELVVTGLAPFMSTTIGFADVTQRKPHPEGVLLVLKYLGVPPARAIFVGDSQADMAAGLAAGCTTVHVTWGLGEGHTLGGLKPHHALATPQELFALLG